VRLNLFRLFCALLTCLALLAVAMPGTAGADDPAPPPADEPSLTLEELPSEKVEEPLVELAEETPVTEQVEIIVFGDSASEAFRTLATDAVALPLIGATSAKIQVGYLDELADDPEIGFMLAGTWNAGTWNAGTWNAGTWNAGTWNSATWNAGTWN
jgi:hypothetical protein